MEFARRSQPVGTQGSPTENLLGPAFAATLDRRRRRYALPPSTVAEVAPVDAFYDRLATPPPAPPAPEPASEFQVSPCATTPPLSLLRQSPDGIAISPFAATPPGASSCSRPFVEPPTAERRGRPGDRPCSTSLAAPLSCSSCSGCAVVAAPDADSTSVDACDVCGDGVSRLPHWWALTLHELVHRDHRSVHREIDRGRHRAGARPDRRRERTKAVGEFLVVEGKARRPHALELRPELRPRRDCVRPASVSSSPSSTASSSSQGRNAINAFPSAVQ